MFANIFVKFENNLWGPVMQFRFQYSHSEQTNYFNLSNPQDSLLLILSTKIIQLEAF